MRWKAAAATLQLPNAGVGCAGERQGAGRAGGKRHVIPEAVPGFESNAHNYLETRKCNTSDRAALLKKMCCAAGVGRDLVRRGSIATKPNPAPRCIPTGCAVARPVQLQIKTFGKVRGCRHCPRGRWARAWHGSQETRGVGNSRNPRLHGNWRKTTITHAGRAERPTLWGDPAVGPGGWKMGCSAPATSSMCGRCCITAASNSIRTNLGFVDQGRGLCLSLLSYYFLCYRLAEPPALSGRVPCRFRASNSFLPRLVPHSFGCADHRWRWCA